LMWAGSDYSFLDTWRVRTFGTETPTFGRFGRDKASGRVHFGNFAEDFRISGPPQLSSARPSKGDKPWVVEKFDHRTSKEHPSRLLFDHCMGLFGLVPSAANAARAHPPGWRLVGLDSSLDRRHPPPRAHTYA